MVCRSFEVIVQTCGSACEEDTTKQKDRGKEEHVERERGGKGEKQVKMEAKRSRSRKFDRGHERGYTRATHCSCS